MIHVWYIYLHLGHLWCKNIGKYIIHGLSGIAMEALDHLVSWFRYIQLVPATRLDVLLLPGYTLTSTASKSSWSSRVSNLAWKTCSHGFRSDLTSEILMCTDSQWINNNPKTSGKTMTKAAPVGFRWIHTINKLKSNMMTPRKSLLFLDEAARMETWPVAGCYWCGEDSNLKKNRACKLGILW